METADIKLKSIVRARRSISVIQNDHPQRPQPGRASAVYPRQPKMPCRTGATQGPKEHFASFNSFRTLGAGCRQTVATGALLCVEHVATLP
jgi:hypothetical protein